MSQGYIEIKTVPVLYPSQAKELVAKGVVVAVLTTGRISERAKDILRSAEIAWAENIPETEMIAFQASEIR